MNRIPWITSTPQQIPAAFSLSSTISVPSTMLYKTDSTWSSVVIGHTLFNVQVPTVQRPRWVFGPSLVQVFPAHRPSRATTPIKSGCCIRTKIPPKTSPTTAREPSGFPLPTSLVSPSEICSHPTRPTHWWIPCLRTTTTVKHLGSVVSPRSRWNHMASRLLCLLTNGSHLFP